jgi:predicted histone-like DNA-binding protein
MEKKLMYVLKEQKMTLGKLKGKTVYVARPTDRKRVSHRAFCEEVARATTFTGAEVEAVLRLAAETAKKHVESGETVDFGDIGSLTPTFKSVAVERKEDFNVQKHIVRPMVKLRPSSRYFGLSGVTYERFVVGAKPEKPKPSGGSPSPVPEG